MNESTHLSPHHTDDWSDSCKLWKENITHKRWLKVSKELEELYHLPIHIDLSLSTCYHLRSRPWINPLLPSEPLAVELVSRLMSVFMTDPHFALIKQRLGSSYVDGVEAINVTVNIPLTTFWAYRRFPYLCRELFNSEIKSHFSLFRNISLHQFFSYTPRFVLSNLDAVLKSRKAANWVHWIVSGKNIRHASGLPFPLTHKMAHWVIQAPESTHFDEALFYGLLRGLGGSDRLYHRLSFYYDQYFRCSHKFCIEVVRFLIRQDDDFNLVDFGDLLGYLQHRYDDGEEHFNLARRSLPPLLRDMQQWYDEIEAYENSQDEYFNTAWDGAPHRGFEGRQQGFHYHIVQLTTYEELCKEGTALRHCVSSYVEDCISGSCSIWSLRRSESSGDLTSLVTIEIDPKGEVVQAQGMKNTYPKAAEMQIIRRWAAVEKLKLSDQYSSGRAG